MHSQPPAMESCVDIGIHMNTSWMLRKEMEAAWGRVRGAFEGAKRDDRFEVEAEVFIDSESRTGFLLSPPFFINKH